MTPQEAIKKISDWCVKSTIREALENREQYKSSLGKHMRVYCYRDEPQFGHSITIRVDYTDLMQRNEYDFAKGLYEEFLRLYRQPKRESDNNVRR